MKKSEALAKQAETIDDVLQEDRYSEIKQLAEFFSTPELVDESRDYDPAELWLMIPYGSRLRELVVEHQTVTAARAGTVSYPPGAD